MSSKKKAASIVKLVSTANTGYFYTTRKSRLLTKKLLLNKYDPVLRRHVLFKEEKISRSKR